MVEHSSAEEVPAALHYRQDPRIGDVVILMEQPHLIAWRMDDLPLAVETMAGIQLIPICMECFLRQDLASNEGLESLHLKI